jgi:hypothetical protein
VRDQGRRAAWGGTKAWRARRRSLEELARGGSDELRWRKGERDPRSCGKSERTGQQHGDAAEIHPWPLPIRVGAPRSELPQQARGTRLAGEGKRSCWRARQNRRHGSASSR